MGIRVFDLTTFPPEETRLLCLEAGLKEDGVILDVGDDSVLTREGVRELLAMPEVVGVFFGYAHESTTLDYFQEATSLSFVGACMAEAAQETVVALIRSNPVACVCVDESIDVNLVLESCRMSKTLQVLSVEAAIGRTAEITELPHLKRLIILAMDSTVIEIEHVPLLESLVFADYSHGPAHIRVRECPSLREILGLPPYIGDLEIVGLHSLERITGVYDSAIHHSVIYATNSVTFFDLPILSSISGAIVSGLRAQFVDVPQLTSLQVVLGTGHAAEKSVAWLTACDLPDLQRLDLWIDSSPRTHSAYEPRVYLDRIPNGSELSVYMIDAPLPKGVVEYLQQTSAAHGGMNGNEGGATPRDRRNALERLELHGVELITEAFSPFGRCHQLRELSLRSCSGGEDVVSHLLQACSTLERLEVRDMVVGESAYHVLEACDTLKSLNLHSSDLCPPDIEALKRLSQLRELVVVCDGGLTAERLEEVKRALTNCDVRLVTPEEK